jgi:SAM-dependent methyltransferase
MSDAKTLEKFYSSKQGQVFSWFLQEEFLRMADFSDNQIAGLGFTSPYKFENFINLCTEEAANSIQIAPTQLPFRNTELKQIIALHYLENTDLPMLALQEIWRVLEPSGSLILVIPNAKSYWKNTAIAGNINFDNKKIIEMLLANKFYIRRQKQAIFHPPAISSEFAKFFNYLPFFGAVTIYQVQKFNFPNRGKPIKISASLRDWVLSKKKTIAT